jgi:aspartyl-tRNA(Asn)/glutamyl-tRNA(Gln) amidotransferase subunit C
MDTIKDFDVEYDAHKDNHNVFLDGLRRDEKAPSMPTEKVLSNAVNSGSSFVVPKVVE